VLLTFGLLSPNKGIETCSMHYRAFWRKFRMSFTSCWAPRTRNELRGYGEAYRLSLEVLATKNKLEKHVIFATSS
jgi:hypothetical protein